MTIQFKVLNEGRREHISVYLTKLFDDEHRSDNEEESKPELEIIYET